jgi:hypothetical protein
MLPRPDPPEEDAVLFVHPELNQPVTAIGGNYVITSEDTIRYGGGELLTFAGHAVFDTTCCGAGGCAYTLVAGFIDSYRCGKDASGRWLSRVKPVRDDCLKKEITARVLAGKDTFQVQFYDNILTWGVFRPSYSIRAPADFFPMVQFTTAAPL